MTRKGKAAELLNDKGTERPRAPDPPPGFRSHHRTQGAAPSPEPRAREWVDEALPLATQPAYKEQVNRILEDPEARDDDIQPIVYPDVCDIQSGVRGVPDYMPKKYQYKSPTDEERSPLGALLRQMPNHLLFVRWKRTPGTIQEFRDREPPIWRDIMAWIEWRGEFLYRTTTSDWYPSWVQEIRDLPSIVYTEP